MFEKKIAIGFSALFLLTIVFLFLFLKPEKQELKDLVNVENFFKFPKRELTLRKTFGEIINPETNEKIVVIPFQNGNVTIKSEKEILCRWSNASDNWKNCEVVIEVENNQNVANLIISNPLSKVAKFTREVKDLSISVSSTFTYYNVSILNTTCFESLSNKEKMKVLRNKSICHYNYTKRNFTDFQPITASLTIPKNSVVGVKLTFKSPINVENGRYVKNHFNFTLLKDFGITLDPEISECSDLTGEGQTYYLTADIVDSMEGFCMWIKADNIILDCQWHLIDAYEKTENAGIYISRGMPAPTSNITVKNCIINDWGVNIGLEYSYNSSFYNIISKNSYSGISFWDSHNNIIYNFTSISNIWEGISIWYSNNNTFYNFTSNSDERGIYLEGNNNTFYNGKIENSSEAGIYLVEWIYGGWYTQFNHFYNIFLNNTNNIGFCSYDSELEYCESNFISTNYWNTTKQPGTRIYSPGTEIGGNYYTNSSGNGYSDICEDEDKDGFCDYPYDLMTNSPCVAGVNCSNNVDYLPLSDEYLVLDFQPPFYSLNSTNSTLAGTPVSHNLFWQDDIGLSHAIFSFDNCTGTLQNISTISLSGNQAWSNFTVIINSTAGCTIRWQVYANDTSNNWNASEIFSYTTTHAYCDIFISSCSNLNQADKYYCLTNNISSASTCFTILANNITLDCQGYWINYSQSTTGYAINNSAGFDNITIKNCNIVQGNSTDSAYAIYASGMINSNIFNNTITTIGYVGHGIHLYSSSNNNITNNNITTSGAHGRGMHIYINSNNNTISNNNIITSGRSGHGIYLISASNFNNVTRNIIITSGHSAQGIGVYSNCRFNILANNSITTSGTSGLGIYVYSSFNNNITSNNVTTSGQGGSGIVIETSSNSVLVNNIVNTSQANSLAISGTSISHFNHTIDTSNLAEGLPILYLFNYHNYELKDQDFTNTYGQIIFAWGTNITVDNITMSNDGINFFNVSNSRITNSIVNTSKGWGIYLTSNSNYNTIINNNIMTSSPFNAHAIYIETSFNNTITNGSYIARGGGTSYDYYLRNVLTTNSFINTNFTAPRRIYFYDNTSWFNYRNTTELPIWLKNRVSATSWINRTLLKWSQQEMKWNEAASTTVTVFYEINGLLPNTLYYIYNGTQLVYTQSTSPTGNLTFNLTITTTARDITVNTTSIGGIVFERVLQESGTLSDGYFKIFMLSRVRSESLVATDSCLKTIYLSRSVSQVSSMSDSYSKIYQTTRSFSDTSFLGDNYLKIIFVARNISNTGTLSDVLSRAIFVVRSFVGTSTLSDSYLKSFRIARSLIETSSLSDNYSKVFAVLRSFTQSLSLQDYYGRMISVLQSFTQSLNLQDYYGRKISLEKVFLGSLSLADIRTRILNKIEVLTQEVTITIETLSALPVQVHEVLVNFVISITTSFSRILGGISGVGRTILVESDDYLGLAFIAVGIVVAIYLKERNKFI